MCAKSAASMSGRRSPGSTPSRKGPPRGGSGAGRPRERIPSPDTGAARPRKSAKPQPPSIRALAEAAGISARSLGRLLRAGLVQRDERGEIAPDAIRAAMVASGPATSVDRLIPRGSSGEAQALAIEQVRQRVLLLELQRREKERSLVPLDAARQAYAGALTALRERLLTLPRSLAPSLAGATARDIERAFDRAIRAALDDARAALEAEP